VKTNSCKEAIIIILQDTLYGIIDWLKSYKRKKNPSLLAYNIDWFTNCTWLEQIQAYKQIYLYLDYGKQGK
jgi:hypothetical protein